MEKKLQECYSKHKANKQTNLTLKPYELLIYILPNLQFSKLVFIVKQDSGGQRLHRAPKPTIGARKSAAISRRIFLIHLHIQICIIQTSTDNEQKSHKPYRCVGIFPHSVSAISNTCRKFTKFPHITPSMSREPLLFYIYNLISYISDIFWKCVQRREIVV